MNLDSGVAAIYEPVNVAQKGDIPKLTYTKEKFKSYYADETVGVNRYYKAKDHDDQTDLLIRIERKGISTACRCKLEPYLDAELGGWYKILQVQHITDENNQPATKLSLERIENLDEP